HPRAWGLGPVVQRRASEGVNFDVRTGLGERDLARGRARRERRRRHAGARGDPGAHVGQADAALAGPRADQAGPLDQLELVEAPGPDPLQIVDAHAETGTNDPRRWWR